MTTPADMADDAHGRVARIVSISLVSLYALVAVGWALSTPSAEAVTAEPVAHVEAKAR